jgi:antitoxin component YwqK of YwqJK toxin-antitoxin module
MTKINQYNEKGQKHGYWELYWSNGNPCFKGNYDNGQPDGYWEVYHQNGNLNYKGNYNNNNPIGYWECHVNGELELQIFYA